MPPAIAQSPEASVRNPARFYSNPAEILSDKRLTGEQKKAALENWRQDQKLMETMETESPAMPLEDIPTSDLLQEVLLAESVLEESDAEDEAQPAIVREAVGIFYDADDLQAAIDSLQGNGFMQHELSVLADEDVIQKKLGRPYNRIEDAAEDPKAPRGVFISQETLGEAEGAVIGLPLYTAATAAAGAAIATGGTVLEAILAAVAGGGAGAGIGAILAMLIARNHADELQRQIDRGGLLLWVHLRTPDRENRAIEVLKAHAAHDVHVHEIAL